MRVASLYDIRANLPALEAVLEEVRAAQVDHIVVGGDVIPGPMPRETRTHMQFDRTIAGIRVVNAGRVGMPFGSTGADWALLDLTFSFGTPTRRSGDQPPLTTN